MALDGRRQFADTMLQAQWLNLRVSIHTPSGVHVWHLSHPRVADKDAPGLFNPKPKLDVGTGAARGSVAGGGSRGGAMRHATAFLFNVISPPINASTPLLSSAPLRAFAASLAGRRRPRRLREQPANDRGGRAGGSLVGSPPLVHRIAPSNTSLWRRYMMTWTKSSMRTTYTRDPDLLGVVARAFPGRGPRLRVDCAFDRGGGPAAP